jgi:dihydrodipicolinate synthase/N-acetylneuraminate lyase
MLFQGIFVPITTPFYSDGKLYRKKLEHNVERYSRTPLAGMVVLGSAGEAVLLSDQERRDTLACARAAAAAEKVLVAGISVESAAEVLSLSEHAAELGYDAVLVPTPYYYRAQMNQPGNMLAFYRFVADRSPLPVIIGNSPQTTGYDLPVELAVELAGHPNLVGIQEAGEWSGSAEKIRVLSEKTRHIKRSVKVTPDFQALTPRMLNAAAAQTATGALLPAGSLPASSSAVNVESGIKFREKEVGFQVLAGGADSLLDSLQAGAVGAVAAFGNPAPTAVYEIYAAWKDGDLKLALEKQQRVACAAARIAGQLGIPGIKYACDLNGYYGGPVRLPLLPLTADLKLEVERLMADIKN